MDKKITTKDKMMKAVQEIVTKSIKLTEEIEKLKKHPNITPNILKQLEKIQNELK